ncbi:hypothetical protein CCACVL1_25733 [Corchorus capsularis]|uniref:RRM domain-containing protein n=1 Tax=Corchorus capsularis TaxID=210143 RepID=A0A1R3GHU9_COCAP|nr:hypothetical protein CCACVL1_25733 [Corchorus capsularis]
MESAEADEYAAFVKKMRRTVYLDNLSPHVTEPVVRTALDQYGTVKSVQFIPNYFEPNNLPRCALVEMEKEKQAEVVVSTLSHYPFMMSGMPRPVRARAAEAEMFSDRPRKPNRRNILFRWVPPTDPDFEVANKLKRLAKRHADETAVMLKHQMDKERELAKQQSETLKANYKKYEGIDSVMADGTARRLARYYGMRVSDDGGPSTFH